MTVKFKGKTYPSEEIMMYSVAKVGDKEDVVNSAIQCTTDYFGWRIEFERLGYRKDKFIEKHGFDFTDAAFITKTCNSVLELFSKYSITDISEEFILFQLPITPLPIAKQYQGKNVKE